MIPMQWRAQFPATASPLTLLMRLALLTRLTPLLLTGCTTTHPPTDTPFTLSLDVSPTVNPDGLGRPAPILVGIYDLKSTAAFTASGFAPLQDHAKASLGDDLVAFDQLILRPGEQRTIERSIERSGDARTRSLGIVAGYRELNRHVWRVAIALPVTDESSVLSFWPFEAQRRVVRVQVKLDDSGIVVRTLNRNP
ncbi:type VI secretion system lipoprotein TssJ [Paraburkholderia sp. BL21I4N1]|uniref:type VI secretion system lipoprotein TssJ n=1 Tax=Paraburkholderia sp. BL21I4N1 TaxID=1938801 RepID=UPI000D46D02D|nr:type VI secretion system lipoprotein TssJ [Paraburkholderia sp. BL21I4N1]PQV48785.1 type VI secretion system protein VasD [Paraburkholderia sp. BL21I4N1]